MCDDELIYLYLAEQNEVAINCLYQHYNLLLTALSKKIFKKFFTIPLEWSDLQSDIYFIFYYSVYSFQPIKNKSFRSYLLTNLNWGILKSLKKYMHKNHQIINLALQYQDYLVSNIYQNCEVTVDLTSYNLNFSYYEKNVLQLKQEGFANAEIMQKLNLSYKQVDNALQRVNMKLKSLKNKC